jgi:dihydrodiol dehydrogenase / D-xylose 1-dehydrogenase (NADP)
MATVFKWGILGPGAIAQKFANGIEALEHAEIAAVASRSLERANVFADQFHITRRYGSYTELANDPDIDAIYVATPHTFHREHSILCLEAGKAVLCEKPFTVNAHQAAEVIEIARWKSVFLMDAMWTRFLPIYITVREWLRTDAIGDVRLLQASCGFRRPWSFEDRKMRLDLAGGALLEVGVYLALASLAFKAPPQSIESMCHLGTTGVDEQSAILLGYESGQLAILSFAINTPMPHDAWICGTKGKIHIPDFWRATRATLLLENGTQTSVEGPLSATGYEYEAAEVIRCVRQDKLESELMPLDETLEIIKTMDRIRVQLGLVYPMDGERAAAF